MLFGEDNGKGIRFNPDTFALEVIDANESPGDVLVHDERNAVVARLLIDLQLPVALGVIYRQPAVAYENAFYEHHPTRMQAHEARCGFHQGTEQLGDYVTSDPAVSDSQKSSRPMTASATTPRPQDANGMSA